MDNQKWQNNVAEICKSKDGKTKYIKVKKDFEVKKGQIINMKSFENYMKELDKAGILKEGEMEDKLKKITWVTHNLSIPPAKEEHIQEDDYDVEAKKGYINDAIEVCSSKDNRLYIKVAHDFSVKKGDVIFLTKFKDKIEELASKGFINDEQKGKMLEVAKWLHYKGTIAPRRE